MRKIINKPEDFVDEVVDGILLAHPQELRAASSDKRALVRGDAGRGSRVGIVTGGGSGHLPLFLGYVGKGLASGVAVGNVFSSPSPQQILDATRASDEGKGVLYLYGNYGGDVYNFDIAGDLAITEGIETSTVLGADDILSAPPEKAETRRGVAGLFFTYKTAGASAERGDSLEEVTRIAQKTCDRTRTMGVGLSPTILPAAGEPTFTLDEGEMEIGIGIHGEPGAHRGQLESADEITDRFLAELFKELPVAEGDRVAVLVNGLGATPLEELYLIYRRTHRAVEERGAKVARVFIGEYATSLEMAGASLSFLHLDDELEELIDAPASSPFYQHAAGSLGTDDSVVGEAKHREHAKNDDEARQIKTVENPSQLRDVVLKVADKLPEHEAELRQLDAALGDGDLGITVSAGARAIHKAVSKLPDNTAPSEILKAAGSAFAAANPSTFAALIGGGLVAGSQVVSDEAPLSGEWFADFTAAVTGRIQERGGAEVGDKTVVDVLDSLATVLGTHTDGAEPGVVAEEARKAAYDVVEHSKSLTSQRGRAAWVGERSVGQADPGQVAALRLLETIEAVLKN